MSRASGLHEEIQALEAANKLLTQKLLDERVAALNKGRELAQAQDEIKSLRHDLTKADQDRNRLLERIEEQHKALLQVPLPPLRLSLVSPFTYHVFSLFSRRTRPPELLVLSSFQPNATLPLPFPPLCAPVRFHFPFMKRACPFFVVALIPIVFPFAFILNLGHLTETPVGTPRLHMCCLALCPYPSSSALVEPIVTVSSLPCIDSLARSFSTIDHLLYSPILPSILGLTLVPHSPPPA